MITVDRSQHRHYEEDGKRYYSVTQVCRQITGEPACIDESSMQRGKDLHDIFALMSLHRQCKADSPTVPYNYAGYYESLSKWMQFYAPSFMFIEAADISGIESVPYAGTPDGIAELSYGKSRARMVIELKTGAPFTWHRVQATAYTYLRNSQCDTYGLLYPDREGGIPRFIIKKRNINDWIVFTSSLNILLWKESV